MKSANKHLPYLDGIRGIAILAVFLFHSLTAAFGYDKLPWSGMFRDFTGSRSFLLLYPISYGFAGVSLFFVISGFCIHLSHQQSSDKGWLCFLNRRFFRIYPPYILAVFFFYFLWPWGPPRPHDMSGLVQVLAHVFSVHNFSDGFFYGINPSFWSIAVEIQLYAVYPLLLLMVRRLGWAKALVIAAVFEFSIRAMSSFRGVYFGDDLPRFITASPFAYWLSWSLGAYLAECHLKQRASRLFSFRFDLVALLCLLAPFFKPTAPFAFPLFAWLTAIAISRFMTHRWPAPERQGRILSACWSHLSFLGLVSYSFYLFHQPIIELTTGALKRILVGVHLHPLIKYLICISWYPFVLIFAYAVYRFIEQPSIAWGKAVWQRIKPRSEAPLSSAVPVEQLPP
jgi:peptidoglycan/LPS O-acetylase OafA/YrhL